MKHTKYNIKQQSLGLCILVSLIFILLSACSSSMHMREEKVEVYVCEDTMNNGEKWILYLYNDQTFVEQISTYTWSGSYIIDKREDRYYLLKEIKSAYDSLLSDAEQQTVNLQQYDEGMDNTETKVTPLISMPFSDNLDTLYYELPNATSETKKLVRRTPQMHGLNNANRNKNFLPQIYEQQLKRLKRWKRRLLFRL